MDYPGAGSTSGASATATGMLADRAGFQKPLAWWFRAWWLSNVSASDAGRPVLWSAATAQPITTCHIVDSWVTPPAGQTTRSVHVYSNAATVQLYVNGKAVGITPVAVPYFGMAVFPAVPYSPGNLTAVAMDSSSISRPLATHSVFTPGALAQMTLTLDAPSQLTGTGSAMVADGQDVAMLRASLVDSHGRLISAQDPKASATNITFKVISGAGRLLGLHNGSPNDVPDGLGSSFPAHHGLVRAFIVSSENHAGPLRTRQLSRYINLDAGKGGRSSATSIVVSEKDHYDDDGRSLSMLEPIVVQASAEGLPSTTISIPLTVDVRELPLAVASELSTARSF